MKYISKSLVSTLLAGLLIGCGSSSEPSVSFSNISGVAVDDLIVDGDVVVYPVGHPNNILKRGKTDASSGAYALELSHNGVVVVEVTCGTTGKMKNPQTGQMRSCEQDLKLHSAAAISSKVSKVTVNVSPVTDFVVAQMNANGGDKVALEAAQKNIGEMFGFDPIGENPTKHSNYAATIDSIRKLADDQNKTMKQIVEAINDDLEDGEAGDDGEIAFELAKVMKKENVNTKFAQNDGVVKPDASESKSDIAVTKDFFNELRTQAMSVVDYDKNGTDGFLDTEAKDLGEILKNETLNVNIVGEYAVGIIKDILDAIDNNQTTHTESGDRTVIVDKKSAYVWDYSITENGTEAFSGTVSLPEQTIKDITPANFTTLVAKFDGTLPLKENASGSQNVKMDVLLTKTSEGASVHVKELSIAHDKTSVVLSDLKGSASYAYDASKPEDESLTANFIQFDGGKIVGKVDGYQLDGVLKISEYVSNTSIKDDGWEKKDYTTNINGQLFCFDNNQRTSISSGVVQYTDKHSVTHDINISSDGYFRREIIGNIDDLSEGSGGNAMNVGPDYSLPYYTLSDNIKVIDTNCTLIKKQYMEVHVRSDREFYNSGKLPKKLSFTGSIKNTKTSGEISGEVKVDWLNAKSINMIKGSKEKPEVEASINGKIKMPSRPEMTLTLGYKNPSQHNNFTFSYAYDATTISGIGAFDKDMQDGKVTLTTHEGVKFIIKVEKGDITYGDDSPVTRNGRRVGTLEERESVPVIKYTDGTFESLL